MSIHLYYTPSRTLALEALATHLCKRVAKDPLALAHVRIVLPYRRACRQLEKSLFARSKTRSMALPEMIAIEDIIYLPELEAFPPAPPFLQELLIDQYLQNHGTHLPLSGGNLGTFTKEVLTFLNLFYRANGTPQCFEKLIPQELALHWQNSWSLIEQLTCAWPHLLEEHGYTIPAKRWTQTLDHWSTAPLPQEHYILGVMGTEPSLKRWLAHVAQSPHGRVIFPGFDPSISGPCPPFHPQHLYQSFLSDFKDHQVTFQEFPAPSLAQEDHFLTQVFSPQLLEKRSSQSPLSWPNISITEADDEKMESQIAALIAREALENPDVSIAIICPEKDQGVQIESELKRWHIEVDCFYGTPFKNTATGALIFQSLGLFKQKKSLSQILDVLKNPLSHILDRQEVRRLELALRKRDQIDDLDQNPVQRLDHVCAHEAWQTLKHHFVHMPHQMSLSAWIHHHIALLEALTKNPENGGADIWIEEAGETASTLFQDLQKQCLHLEGTHLYTLSAYKDYLDRLCASQEIRSPFAHPRLGIYDTGAALSVVASHVILVGLNDGVWPNQFNQLPWLSRTMRESLNLPEQDVAKGQEAFSFSQFLTRDRVTITYAKNRRGAPCLMSPWLYRLKALAELQGKDIFQSPPSLLHRLDLPPHPFSITRPVGTPPLNRRPKEISVSDVDLLSKDSYEFYWRKVLKLRPLAPLELFTQPYHYGQWIHHFLDKITRTTLSFPQACALMIENLPQSIPQKTLWHLTAEETLHWLNQHNLWPNTHAISHSEISVQCENFLKTSLKIRGIIDRLDQTPQAHILYDYKTGRLPPEKSFKNGEAPQLPLLLHLYEQMNPGTKIHGIGYLGLKDQTALVVDKTLDETLYKALDHTRELLVHYLVEDNAFQAPYNPLHTDSRYFSRLQEWHHGA